MKELERKLQEFAAERDWDKYHSPKNLAIGISVEANELLELFMWLTEQQSAQPSSQQLERIREEVGDITIQLVNFCRKLGELPPLSVPTKRLRSTDESILSRKASDLRENTMNWVVNARGAVEPGMHPGAVRSRVLHNEPARKHYGPLEYTPARRSSGRGQAAPPSFDVGRSCLER
jgi:NTP pyrophosphatase (non-canonical NTP hydrolase)